MSKKVYSVIVEILNILIIGSVWFLCGLAVQAGSADPSSLAELPRLIGSIIAIVATLCWAVLAFIPLKDRKKKAVTSDTDVAPKENEEENEEEEE